MKHTIIVSAMTMLFFIGNITASSKIFKNDDLNISIVVPLQIEGLSVSQLSKLETKMLKMVSNYGISGEGFTDKFILYPKYEIYEHNVVEGMQNVHVMEVEISFIVKEVKTGKVYSIYSQEITGDGYSKKEAINQSISKITTKSEKIETFLNGAKSKILNYYRTNCNRLHAEATTMVNQKRFNEAIALLYPVPKEVGGSCYNKIQSKLDEAYNGYLNKTCEKSLVQAKAEISKNNNESALEILGSIEAETKCHESAKQLKAEINATKSTTETTENHTEKIIPTPTKVRKETKLKAIAKAEFTRTRHQGEIDRAMQEG